jgi:hypothetical protein
VNFGVVTKELNDIRKRLEELAALESSRHQAEMNALSNHMDELLYREEMMWRQHSRISWLKEGDRNTKFFYHKVAGRAKKNKIKALKKDDGQVTKEKSEMEAMASQFFQDLYTTNQTVNSQDLIQLFEQKNSEGTNGDLCRDYSDEEISDVLFLIGPIKVPGPDGFPARFFQKKWDTMRADVIRGVKRFFETRHMPPAMNQTAIVLIPNKDEPELLKGFRPISLCNVIYKVVSKCIVNRLRSVLHDIIGPMQSAFIPGRLITDNALIAFECIHAMKNGNNNSKKFCAYKLDLSKAYDRVDWGFLEGVLRRLGFHSKWVQWVMACVTIVQYSVCFNNVPLEPFKPTHGLRQGDPLSPYLFLFVTDGLSKLIQHETQQGLYESNMFAGEHWASPTYCLPMTYYSSWRRMKTKQL